MTGEVSSFSKDNAQFFLFYFYTRVDISSCRMFVVCSVMKNSSFDLKGFNFEMRSRGISTYLRARLMHLMES